MTWRQALEKISPKAIFEAQQLGTQRNAFDMRASAVFRSRAVAEAQKLGLRGFLSTGVEHSVRGMVEGPADDIDAFFDWCVDNADAGVIPAVIDITGEDDRPLPAFHDRDAADCTNG